MGIHARLHVLLARNSDKAIVIRRGPSKQVAVIGWNRKDDAFTIGQWLKGKIYPFRSDISPDGSRWIYFAMSDKNNETYTCVAKTPFLKAEDFYMKGDAWNGGGLFIDDYTYWLNDGLTMHDKQRKNSALMVVSENKYCDNYFGECPNIYFARIERDGWVKEHKIQYGRSSSLVTFSKTIHSSWVLQKLFHGTINFPAGKSPYYEEHVLFNTTTKEQILCKDWEWADMDGNRLVWAAYGKILTGSITETGVENISELYDANQLVFSELVAPY